MSRDKGLMIELLSDLLQRPQLPSAEFTKVQQRLVQEIAAAKDGDPRQLVPIYFNALVYASHPYGHESDETSLAAISYDDVKKYYEQQMGGDRTILTFVGDFNAKQLASDLRKALGSWRKASGTLPAVTALPHPTGRRVLLVDKPGATQTYFWIGNVGIARNDPERVAVDLANTAFGGRFTSMLNTELRIKSGLSYGARSSLIRRTQAGPVAISSYTKTDSTEKALDLALDVLKRFRSSGLDAQTLASVKSYVVGQFAPTIETSSQVAAKLTELAFYGLDASDVSQYATNVAALKGEDVMKTLQRVYPSPENLTFVLIGDASKIRDVAKKYGPVTEMKITEKHFVPTR
jgi:predicted Zn-dependent peptidase